MPRSSGLSRPKRRDTIRAAASGGWDGPGVIRWPGRAHPAWDYRREPPRPAWPGCVRHPSASQCIAAQPTRQQYGEQDDGNSHVNQSPRAVARQTDGHLAKSSMQMESLAHEQRAAPASPGANPDRGGTNKPSAAWRRGRPGPGINKHEQISMGLSPSTVTRMVHPADMEAPATRQVLDLRRGQRCSASVDGQRSCRDLLGNRAALYNNQSDLQADGGADMANTPSWP